MELLNFLETNNIEFKLNQKLSNYTNFKIGGECKIIVLPNKISKLIKVLKYLKTNDIKFFILGSGTNILASDNGYNGVIVKLGNVLNGYKINENYVYAESGLNSFLLNNILCKNNLSGLEFTYGIPGSVGGMITMNAGAYGHSISEKVYSVKIFDGEKIKTLKFRDMNFNYRSSIIVEKNYVVLGATFILEKKDGLLINEKMNEYFEKRKETQPYFSNCIGSIFKRLDDGKIAVSRLIDNLGLKGKSFGDAQISNIHAGFIVNNGKASCQDVIKLINYIIVAIKNNYGYNLQLEIKLLGDINTNGIIR